MIRLVPYGQCVLAIALGGCVSPHPLAYRPDVPGSPASGGYSELAFDDTHYRIRVSEPHGTRRQPMEAIALRRAAELSLASRSYGFVILQRTFADHVYTAANRRGTIRATYEPGYDAWANYWRLYRYGLGLQDLRTEPSWFLHDDDRAKYRRVEFYLDIELRTEPGEGVMNAREVLSSRQGGIP